MKQPDDNGLIVLAFVIGIPVFLLLVYPLVFWLVFVPLLILGTVKFVNWLKK